MMKTQIVGITIAISNMERMLVFYKKLFGVEFHKKDSIGIEVFEGFLGGLKLTFCPKEIAGVYVDKNNHQLEIIVNDLQEILERVSELSGRILGDMHENELYCFIGIEDPDNNSILLKEPVKT